MIIAEVKNELATVRIHDEYYRKETEQTMTEINQIVSQAYKRRISVANPLLPGNASIHAEQH